MHLISTCLCSDLFPDVKSLEETERRIQKLLHFHCVKAARFSFIFVLYFLVHFFIYLKVDLRPQMVAQCGIGIGT